MPTPTPKTRSAAPSPLPSSHLQPREPPSLQESIKNSTDRWQEDLAGLFAHAKDRFPDVVWELSHEENEDRPYAGGVAGALGLGGMAGIGGGGYGIELDFDGGGWREDDRERKNALGGKVEEVWGHKAIVYARAPPSFQNRYFNVRQPGYSSTSPSPFGYDDDEDHDDEGGYQRSIVSMERQSRTPSPTSTSGHGRLTRTGNNSSHGHSSSSSGHGHTAGKNVLRINTSLNPALFADELEYLYTGRGFGEAFEFLFDAVEGGGGSVEPPSVKPPLGLAAGLCTTDDGDSMDVDASLASSLAVSLHNGHQGSSLHKASTASAPLTAMPTGVSRASADREAARIDKLRKDLVFMWRSRLYSDVRIALTGNFSSGSKDGRGHEATTAIFSSHRFMLVSRSTYFHDALVGFPSSSRAVARKSLAPTRGRHSSMGHGAIPDIDAMMDGEEGGDVPTLTLPAPPFTPASLHFTLGFIYTGTLIFSHRTYDLSTAFAIMRSSLYLGVDTLHDEVQARIIQEMTHGLFHAFLPFHEYEELTKGRWGVGGCRCRQCARRVPRVLEFALSDDVNTSFTPRTALGPAPPPAISALERGSRRALVGMFGESWCTSEFAALAPKIRSSILKGLAKRTTPVNVFPLLFAAEHALLKLGPSLEAWADTVRADVFAARKVVDEVLGRESEACFGFAGDEQGRATAATPHGGCGEWEALLEAEGIGYDGGEGGVGRFGDVEKVEWAMAAVLRGVKEAWAATLYQTLVSSILLRPHPTVDNAPLLSATSAIRACVENTRLELLKWIGRRWIGIRHESGFDALEGWALKEISDHIEVPIEDLLNPNPPPPKPTPSANRTQSPNASPSTTGSTTLSRSAATRGTGGSRGRGGAGAGFLRPVSHHPHTSRIDTDSDLASSMRASVLTRNTRATGTTSTTGTGTTGSVPTRRTAPGHSSGSGAAGAVSQRRNPTAGDNQSIASSVRSVARSLVSTASYDSSASGSTVGVAPRRRTTTAPSAMSSSVVSSRAGSAVVGPDGEDSPAKRIAASVRSRMVLDEKREREAEVSGDRPDSKLTPSPAPTPVVTPPPTAVPPPAADAAPTLSRKPSIIESSYDSERDGSGDADDGKDDDEDDDSDRSVDGDSTSTAGHHNVGRGGKTPTRSNTVTSRRTASNVGGAVKKTVIAKASLASMTSRGTTSTMSRASSVRSIQTNNLGAPPRKVSGGSAAAVPKSPVHPRPTSRGSTRAGSAVSTATSRSAASRSTLSSVSTNTRTTGSRPGSRLSSATNSSVAGGRAPSSISATSSTTTDRTFRTASAGGLASPITPTTMGIRSRKSSAASTVSTASTRTTTSIAGGGANTPRTRRVSTSSIGSVASSRSPTRTRGHMAPPVPPIDPTKLSPTAVRRPAVSMSGLSSPKPKAAALPAPSLRSSSSNLSLRSTASRTGPVPVKKVASSPAPAKSDVSVSGGGARVVAKAKKAVDADVDMGSPDPRNGSLPSTPSGSYMSLEAESDVSFTPTSATEHKKTGSSASLASNSSVATIRSRNRDSVDTIVSRSTSKSKDTTTSSFADASSNLSYNTSSPPARGSSPPLPPLPPKSEVSESDAGSSHMDFQDAEDDEVEYDPNYVPQGASLEIGIPCIVTCKRKRFKAYARYIGEIQGERGPWVGIEVPMPAWEGAGSMGGGGAFGGAFGYSALSFETQPSIVSDIDERQWHDGTWCGVRYFAISNHGTDGWDREDDGGRAARRRRTDGGGGLREWGHASTSSASSHMSGSLYGKALKRDGDAMSFQERKKMRSVSPTMSESSSMVESRGLFVRPQQVLFVLQES